MVGVGKLNTKLSEFLFDQVAMTHRFVVQIDLEEYDLGTWTKVAGLQVTWSKHKYRPGDNNDELIFPGNVEYPTIKLSRAASSKSANVQEWLKRTSRSHTVLSGGIHMLDYLGVPVITWELKQFFPVGWSISDFDSTSGRPAIETLELAHTGFLDDEKRS
ncbi:phage tail protein [Amycolatopsis sp. lyj-23]|uniref:phage tail protein n=1 Tax=Amycolatopsis sp. lyj-23 TaxID=2789283 RepID=UPI00397C42AE